MSSNQSNPQVIVNVNIPAETVSKNQNNSDKDSNASEQPVSSNFLKRVNLDSQVHNQPNKRVKLNIINKPIENDIIVQPSEQKSNNDVDKNVSVSKLLSLSSDVNVPLMAKTVPLDNRLFNIAKNLNHDLTKILQPKNIQKETVNDTVDAMTTNNVPDKPETKPSSDKNIELEIVEIPKPTNSSSKNTEQKSENSLKNPVLIPKPIHLNLDFYENNIKSLHSKFYHTCITSFYDKIINTFDNVLYNTIITNEANKEKQINTLVSHFSNFDVVLSLYKNLNIKELSLLPVQPAAFILIITSILTQLKTQISLVNQKNIHSAFTIATFDSFLTNLILLCEFILTEYSQLILSKYPDLVSLRSELYVFMDVATHLSIRILGTPILKTSVAHSSIVNRATLINKHSTRTKFVLSNMIFK